MPQLTFHTYGKTRVRLMQVLRQKRRHDVIEISVDVLLEGDLADSFESGNNSRVLPTDTMKNTVYVIARQKPIRSIERFAIDLGTHFLERLSYVTKVSLEITELHWQRIGEHADAFLQTREQRTVKLAARRDGNTLVCGVRNLQILKTGNSSFVGFLKDEYTTLPETRDRLLGTVLDAYWNITADETTDFADLHNGIRDTLLNAFASHNSRSVQETLYEMGDAVLREFGQVQEIQLVMPNKHCLLVDLSRFGLDNPNQIFVPTDEPSGHIEARMVR